MKDVLCCESKKALSAARQEIEKLKKLVEDYAKKDLTGKV